MLDREVFDKNIFMVLYFQSVEFEKEKNNFLYNLIKSDFENDEFCEICKEICKIEELYNKYPTPKMFYSRQKKQENNILVEQGVFFLDDTMPEYKEYLKGMSDDEVENVWRWIYKNKQGEFVSREWIIERIKQFNTKQNIKQLEQYPTLSEVKMLLENHYKMEE